MDRIGLLLMVTLAACVLDCGGSRTDVEDQSGSRSGTLSIGAFNIQVFGLDKMTDEVAVANIIEVSFNCEYGHIEVFRKSCSNLMELSSVQHQQL